MDGPLYVLTQIALILIVVGLLLCISFGLRHVWKQRQVEAAQSKKLLNYVLASLIIWLTILGLLNFGGYFRNFRMIVPRTMLIMLPPLILVFYLMISRRFSQNILSYVPGRWLIYVQSFRIFMELIFWVGLLGGFVPFQMTFAGLNFDIVVGITALIAGSVFFAKGRFRKFEVFIWNIFGLALLANILIIAFLSAPSPFRVFLNEPANTLVGFFPFIWIPGFLVPFALAMHLFSIKQIFILSRRKFRFSLRRK